MRVFNATIFVVLVIVAVAGVVLAAANLVQFWTQGTMRYLVAAVMAVGATVAACWCARVLRTEEWT